MLYAFGNITAAKPLRTKTFGGDLRTGDHPPGHLGTLEFKPEVVTVSANGQHKSYMEAVGVHLYA
ncbi:hypothetical protein LOZ39_004092 [Ophidiomyces ophidiicola]|nr:hypothetical protein LOZ39_004092 [Ophidiomyces ophidiicola]